MKLMTTVASSLLAVISANAGSSALQINVGPNGSYNVMVAGSNWFSSQGPVFSVNGMAYSAADGSLRLVSNSSSAGSDGIGAYDSIAMLWSAGDAAATHVVTTFNVYASGDAISFETAFPSGLKSQTAPAATGGLSITFPSLQAASGFNSAQAGILAQDPKSGNCGWTVAGTSTFPVASGGLQVLHMPGASLGFAALTAQPVVRQSTVGPSLVAGPGEEFDLPPGWTSATILVASVEGYSSTIPVRTPVTNLPGVSVTRADLGYPSGGPNAALALLGDAMLAYHSKTRPAINFDRIHATLGVGSTVFYFYNPCDCGRWPNNTCPPDTGSNPFRTPNCLTYGDSLQASHAAMKAQGLPYGHMLLDSWWYGEGIYGGVSQWEDDPSLMAAVHSFTGSLGSFASSLGSDVVLWAHNGRWVTSSPYIQQYSFAAGTTMPQGRGLWDHVFTSNAADWKLRMIKQDHVGEQIGLAGVISNASQISAWLGGMGEAAVDAGVNIQYCCSPPLVLHNGVNVPTAVSARSSPDYVAFANHDGQIRPRFQWANGVEAAFHYAMGLIPDKDGFYSNATEVQHGGDGIPTKYWPSFYNGTGWTEANPLLHALMALACGGPVAPSDRPGSTNATLRWSLMRADGTLLRTSRPHSALDKEMYSIMHGGWQENAKLTGTVQVGEVVGRVRADGTVLANADGSFPNAGRGELYSSVTLLPAVSSGSGAGAACVRYTTITAAELDTALNVTAADLSLDTASLSTAACSANGNSWATYAWDLSSFSPSLTSNGLPRVVFGGGGAGGDGDAIALQATAAAGYAGVPTMAMVAPVVGGWLVLGEQGKMLPASPQRLSYLQQAPGGSGVQVGLVGSAGEVVTLSACPMGATACTTAPASFSCSLPASGTAVLSLPAGTCA